MYRNRVGLMHRQSAALRLALSAVLPVVLVVYAVWSGARGAGPGELYVIWNSAQPQTYAGQHVYLQTAPGAWGQTNTYFNAANTAELSVNVNPYDAAALQYSGSGPPQNQIQTLHALASAKRLYHQMQAPAAGNQYDSYWSKKAKNPTAALQALQSKMGSGSQASKQIAQARLAIQQVMQQSKADHRVAKAATRGEQPKGGNSWKSLLSRESGPQKTAMASDWLATAVATSKGSKTKYARAQLEAALSQVDGKYSHNAERSAWSNQKRERNSELTAMSNLAHAVMFKALSGSRSGGPTAVAPISTSWSTNSAGAGFGYDSDSGGGSSGGPGGGSSEGGGGGPSGGKAAESGTAPGLSSYDAQILAQGPP